MVCNSYNNFIDYFYFTFGYTLMYREGYHTKLLVRLGWREEKKETNWALYSWSNMVEKLNYQADIVFFGDSITRGSDFQKKFPNKKIVNLGYTGDNLSGMIDRIPMVQSFQPKQVFVLGGINELNDKGVGISVANYAKLLDQMIEALPDARIYVQSVLPISLEKEKVLCKNETILYFNQQISILARERGLPFIDLHTLYVKDGVFDPELTKDGIHLHPHAYERWEKVLREYIS